MTRDEVITAMWEAIHVEPMARDWIETALQVAKQNGYVLVPDVATPEMISAGHLHDPLACDVEGSEVTIYSAIWRAMVAAANDDNKGK